MLKIMSKFITSLLLLCTVSARSSSAAAVSHVLHASEPPPPRQVKEVLLVMGGVSDQDCEGMLSVELLDLTPSPSSTGRQRIAARMPGTGRRLFAGATLGNIVYVCGGLSAADESTLKSCLTYDPMANVWNTTGMADMHDVRFNFALASHGRDTLCAVGGLTLAGGGTSLECYNVTTNSWSRRAAFPGYSLSGHNLVSLHGYLYVVDGWSEAGRVLFRYDPVRNAWHGLHGLPTTWRRLSLVAVPSSSSSGLGYLYAIGGYDGHTEMDTVVRFNIATDRWETDGFPGTRLTAGVYSPSAAQLGSTIYAVGGLQKNNTADDGYRMVNTIQTLSLAADDDDGTPPESAAASSSSAGWVKLSRTMIEPRHGHIVLVVQIYV